MQEVYVPLHAAYRGFIGDIFVKWKFEAITRLENNLRVRNDYKGYIDSVVDEPHITLSTTPGGENLLSSVGRYSTISVSASSCLSALLHLPPIRLTGNTFSLGQNTLSRENSRRASGYRSDSGGSNSLNAVFRAFSLHDGGETPTPLSLGTQCGMPEEEAQSEGGYSPHLYLLQPTLSHSSTLHSTRPQQTMLLPPMASKFEPDIHNQCFIDTPNYLAPETINGVDQDEMSDWRSLGCINAPTPDSVFENILHRRIEHADELASPEAIDLMNKLMTINPQERLGANSSLVLRHQWDILLEDKAQFVPITENSEDTEYFDSRGATLQEFTEEVEDQPPTKRQVAAGDYAGRPHNPLFMVDYFGNFNFKNLLMLEKANEDVIQLLRQEAMQVQQRAYTSAAQTPVSSSGPSLEGSPLLPMPLQRAVSQNKGSNRPNSPSSHSQANSSPSRHLQDWDLFDINEGIDGPSWQDNEGWAPLHLSVVGGHPLTTGALLDAENWKGPNKDKVAIRKNVSQSSAVSAMAIKANFVDIVYLLVEAGVDINYQDEQGETALHIAARFGHDKCAKLLPEGSKEQKANMELAEYAYLWTPIFIACVDGSYSVVELLIQAGADLERCDSSGWTPKEHAALRGHMDIARRLEEATPSADVSDGETVIPIPSLSAPPSQSSVVERKSNGIVGSSALRATEPIKTFGHRYLTDKSMILVSIGTMDMRKHTPAVSLDQIPMANAHSTQLDTALSIVVSASGAHGESEVIDLPIQDNISTEPITYLLHG
ncbi:hypothetical protein V8E54_000202 [Elaphomyces granulatus]